MSDAGILPGVQQLLMTGTIGKAVVVSKQNHSVAGIRTLAAGRTMVKGSSCAESGPHASLHSGSTHQQVLSTSHDNNNSSMHVDSAPAAAAPSQQPASPESVNDGQATPAPAPKSPSLPANTQNNVSTKDVVEGAEGVPDPAAVQAAAVPPAPAQRSPTPVEPSEEAAKVEQTLEPLPAPNASEDAEVHAEYEVYLARWRAGTTLRQRWHRLKAKGLLSDIQAEWEDWQHDLLLDTIRQQLTNPGSCAAPAKRRGRAELEAPSNTTAAPATQAAAAAAQEPRRVRTRRAPASFQDFHVETPASGSPDRADINLPAVAAADTQRRVLSMQQQQQQQLHAAADRAAWDQAPTRAGLNGYSGRQQQQQHLLPPPLPRLSNLGRQQQQHRLGASQPHSEVVSDEFLSKFQRTIQLVLSSGNAQGMEGAAALLADPSALKAFVNALSQHTDNPAAAMHRVAATLAGQQVQP